MGGLRRMEEVGGERIERKVEQEREEERGEEEGKGKRRKEE